MSIKSAALLLVTLCASSLCIAQTNDRFVNAHNQWFNDIRDTADKVYAAYDQILNVEKIEPDYNPTRYPSLMSQCYFSDECRSCLKDLPQQLHNSFFALENRFRLYQKITIRFNALKNLAPNANQIPLFHVYVWGLESGTTLDSLKNDLQRQLNQYDNEQKAEFERLKNTLIGLSRCENDVLGESDWLKSQAAPFINQLVSRYKR